jgi:DNA-binding Lrp family transcriptional regulator
MAEDVEIEAAESIESRVDTSILFKMRYERKLSFGEIGRLTGLSTQAVHQRIGKFLKRLGEPEKVANYRDHKPEILEAVHLRLVEHMIDGDKLAKASINNLAFAARQIYDMHRLETNQSTVNLSSISHLIDQSHDASIKAGHNSTAKPSTSDKK